MGKTVSTLSKDLATLRAGRATPALLDRITVDYYGTPTPLNQLAGISAPEPRLLVIQPWDKSALKDMEKAIQKSDLGLNPTNDGTILRLAIPQLTRERRADLVKVVRKKTEEAKVAVRNIRREIIESIRELSKDGELPEDSAHRTQDEVQKITDRHINQLEALAESKEKEIMEV
ncbi:MAG: ribosome recycling factor [Firmicutes bacterium]|nr:ribosome recycling factor [Bacillota bacterium]